MTVDFAGSFSEFIAPVFHSVGDEHKRRYQLGGVRNTGEYFLQVGSHGGIEGNESSEEELKSIKDSINQCEKELKSIAIQSQDEIVKKICEDKERREKNPDLKQILSTKEEQEHLKICLVCQEPFDTVLQNQLPPSLRVGCCTNDPGHFMCSACSYQNLLTLNPNPKGGGGEDSDEISVGRLFSCPACRSPAVTQLPIVHLESLLTLSNFWHIFRIATVLRDQYENFGLFDFCVEFVLKGKWIKNVLFSATSLKKVAFESENLHPHSAFLKKHNLKEILMNVPVVKDQVERWRFEETGEVPGLLLGWELEGETSSDDDVRYDRQPRTLTLEEAQYERELQGFKETAERMQREVELAKLNNKPKKAERLERLAERQQQQQQKTGGDLRLAVPKGGSKERPKWSSGIKPTLKKT